MRRPPGGVAFYEYPLWFCVALALFINISSSILGITLRQADAFKHIPLLLFLPSFLLYGLCRRLAYLPPLYAEQWLRRLWPFLVLGLFALAGSLYARFVLNIKETFLNLGLYLTVMPLFFFWGSEVGNRRKIVTPFIRLWGAASLISIAGAFFYLREGATLHEEEFIVLPFFVYLVLAQSSILGKVWSLILLFLATFLTQKLTGYVGGVLALAYIGMVDFSRWAPFKWRALIKVISPIFAIGVVGLTLIAYVFFREELPSGNVDVRLHQYRTILETFFNSPVFGEAYTGESGVIYVENGQRLNIPSHSDVLDLLRAGGVTAFVLWAAAVGMSVGYFVAEASRREETAAFFYAMAFLAGYSAICASVNPIFLTPTAGFFLWGSLAVALGVASDRRRGQFNAA